MAQEDMKVQKKTEESGMLGSLWPDFPLLATKNTTTTGEKETIWKVFKDNIYAGSTVALISLPLSASLGIASNVNPMVGI